MRREFWGTALSVAVGVMGLCSYYLVLKYQPDPEHHLARAVAYGIAALGSGVVGQITETGLLAAWRGFFIAVMVLFPIPIDGDPVADFANVTFLSLILGLTPAYLGFRWLGRGSAGLPSVLELDDDDDFE